MMQKNKKEIVGFIGEGKEREVCIDPFKNLLYAVFSKQFRLGISPHAQFPVYREDKLIVGFNYKANIPRRKDHKKIRQEWERKNIKIRHHVKKAYLKNIKINSRIKKTYAKNIDCRITCNLWNRIRSTLITNYETEPISRLLNCSVKHFKEHLKKQFTKGMSFENYGKWHIDHITPCRLFDLSDPQERKECFHYSNLQPLWAKDNLKKGGKGIRQLKLIDV